MSFTSVFNLNTLHIPVDEELVRLGYFIHFGIQTLSNSFNGLARICTPLHDFISGGRD